MSLISMRNVSRIPTKKDKIQMLNHPNIISIWNRFTNKKWSIIQACEERLIQINETTYVEQMQEKCEEEGHRLFGFVHNIRKVRIWVTLPPLRRNLYNIPEPSSPDSVEKEFPISASMQSRKLIDCISIWKKINFPSYIREFFIYSLN